MALGFERLGGLSPAVQIAQEIHQARRPLLVHRVEHLVAIAVEADLRRHVEHLEPGDP